MAKTTKKMTMKEEDAYCIPCHRTPGWHVLCWFVAITVLFTGIALLYSLFGGYGRYDKYRAPGSSGEYRMMLERMDRMETSINELKMMQAEGMMKAEGEMMEASQ